MIVIFYFVSYVVEKCFSLWENILCLRKYYIKKNYQKAIVIYSYFEVKLKNI